MVKPGAVPGNLLAAAVAAMKNAYAPYSKFAVGAALETKAGQIFTGCNVENASYGATLCAERVAIFSAVSQGHREFTRLVLISKNPEPITPCGICRQVMAEFFSPEAEIICYGSNDSTATVYKLADLLPAAFTNKNL